MMRRLLLVWLCALCLVSVAHAADDPMGIGGQLSESAGVAYEDKRLAEAAELYVRAAKAGAPKATAYYNAACSYALAGMPDQAFASLQESIDAGLGGQSPADDTDFASLRSDARWPKLLAKYEAAHPELKILKSLADPSVPSATRYFSGRKAIAEGAPTTDTSSRFNQYYANTAQFVGEYDEASRVYGFGRPVMENPVAAGFDRAVDALPLVLERARGRQAVFLNESHGQSQTRAANFALLSGLRAEGFDVLAMETLAAIPDAPREGAHCASASLVDAGLQERGYPIGKSGYYSLDPVYAETIREALRLGFRLVAYDDYLTSPDVAKREQNEAEHLACVFKEDPKARMVVVAGFSHIAEGKDFWVPGGAMAYRFRALTGIDPLSVDTTSQLEIDPKSLHFAAHDGRPPVSYVLQNATGEAWGGKQFDLALYVPAPAHRNDGEASWLELGGLRLRTAVAASECQGKDPCLAEARRTGEVADAVPSDRCIIGGAMPGCTLFLRPGKYEVLTFDAAGIELAHRQVEVGG